MGCGSSASRSAQAASDKASNPPGSKAVAVDPSQGHYGATGEAAAHFDQPIAKFYTFGPKIGSGSFATVFAGRRRADNMEVAIKAIDEKSKNFAKEDLEVEVSVLLRVHHPNIIKLYEVFESKDFFYMILEKVDGGELFDHIIARGHYSERSAAVIMQQVLSGIAHLHEHGVVHRDLKPENLLYDSSTGEDIIIKIADFGLSAIVKQDELLDVACGSPGYVAPEILKRETYNSAVDLWSAGVILYILLSGFTPFAGGDEEALYDAITTGAYSLDGPEWRAISREAKQLVRCLMDVNPTTRWTAKKALQYPWLAGSAPDVHLSDIVFAMTAWKRDTNAVVHGKLLGWAKNARAAVSSRRGVAGAAGASSASRAAGANARPRASRNTPGTK